MKLQTNELKKFKAVAGALKQNSILPILGYLKFDNSTITKSNLESFVVMDADFEGSFLVDEKILFSFVESINAKEIDVTVTEKSVILSCGGQKYKSPTDEVKNFPVIVDAIGDEIEFDDVLLSKIKEASAFTIDRDNMPFTQCVFLGNGVISASTGFVAYTNKVDEDIPQIILEKNTVDAISKFSNVSFSQNDTYQFYRNGNFKFGFVKKDTQYINMKQFSILPKDVEGVWVEKGEVINFCDLCINSCQGRFVVAKMEGNSLLMNDPAYENDCEKQISATLTNFTFNPSLLGKMLKSLPEEKLLFTHSTNKYFVTGESGYVSLIMEMQIVNPIK